MHLSNGYLTLGQPSGVPIRVHWTLPLGALFFSRFTWSPGFWLGFFLLILAHELGHAALVRLRKGTVTEVIVHGIGGECRHTGAYSELSSSIIAWGGVLAQAVLLAGAFAYQKLVGAGSPFVAQLLGVWIETNLTLMAINLLPIAPLDGARAWKLPGLLRARRPQERPRATRPKLRLIKGQKGADLDEADPPPMSDALKKEIERITREALRDARKDRN
ncbi:MAG: hypothetical protein MUF64_16890 [Polyangiaceae bacterium]|jgi:hypothetical protein|nr:hypothetical protein [Polyangiaceae bacterium]